MAHNVQLGGEEDTFMENPKGILFHIRHLEFKLIIFFFFFFLMALKIDTGHFVQLALQENQLPERKPSSAPGSLHRVALSVTDVLEADTLSAFFFVSFSGE